MGEDGGEEGKEGDEGEELHFDKELLGLASRAGDGRLKGGGRRGKRVAIRPFIFDSEGQRRCRLQLNMDRAFGVVIRHG